MNFEVLHNQSLLDIAIQHTGNAQNAFLIAKENSLSVTSYLVPGYQLIIPDGVPFNRDMLGFYTAKNLKPATDHTIEDGADGENLEGIGYWIIDKTFKVS
ncbi:hypothetical protein EGI11_03315 [Chryseobacterium sp. H3056]|uniref:Uncharacterized protein n=1 Tax=Kaistella daneshvariae TaxID=2487074 RepID=A0A3N0WXK9_9FLAO|nr:hypothetical protein [Kaistella daneshvariae]ROI09800.1 hypothetical protein EGI11_03315 [Kaistella daneshvariae]